MAIERFNDASPLDKDKLNELIDAIETLNKNTGLANQTNGTTGVAYTPVIDSGIIGPVTLGKSGVAVMADIAFKIPFSAKPALSVVAAHGNTTSDAYPVLAINSISTTGAKINAIPSAKFANKKIWIHWTAVYMKPNA